ncbi:MAG: PHP domain-containing protein [Gemmatimonadetes bacterium]|nr:PHP domain-containing protein [Gemmatimonadota bacterium]
MRLDLHVHSTASDGTVAPAEVVRLAAQGGLDVIAVSDHDSVAGVQEAREAARSYSIQIVPALEVSSTSSEREIHILGYFVEPEADSIAAHQERAGRVRNERMSEMVGRLNSAGVAVTMDDVLEFSGGPPTMIGRPHLAKALVQRGHVATVPEAFERFIGDGMDAHVPTRLADPAEAIQLIEAAGGIAVWAHPPQDLLQDLLPGLVNAGLKGLEIYRPKARADQVLVMERAAAEAGLMVSGGSDWHSPESGTALGKFFVTADEVALLLEAGGI